MLTVQEVKNFVKSIKDEYGNGYPTGRRLFTNIREIAKLCGLCATSDEMGAIGFCPVSDKNNVHLIVLGGTDLRSKSESLGIEEDIRSAFNIENDYFNKALSEIFANIPVDSGIYIYGYSLGGMVMQQILSDRTFKKHYKVLHSVAIGSPIITTQRRKIVFIEDESDFVPNLSFISAILKKHYAKYDTHIRRNGGYKTTIGAHALSYISSDIWKDVDAFGIINGGGSFEIDMDDFKTFFA